jgi:hypothetical protein
MTTGCLHGADEYCTCVNWTLERKMKKYKRALELAVTYIGQWTPNSDYEAQTTAYWIAQVEQEKGVYDV